MENVEYCESEITDFESEPLCKGCQGNKDDKPIHFFWENDQFYMGHEEEKVNLNTNSNLNIPEGISDFQICFDCLEVLTDYSEDVSKYELLVNDIFKDIIENTIDQSNSEGIDK